MTVFRPTTYGIAGLIVTVALGAAAPATAAPTARMVEDIRPGAEGSYPSPPVAVGRKVVFTAHVGKRGWQLFVSDGTKRGTRQIFDFRPSDSYGDIKSLTAAGRTAYFTVACARLPGRDPCESSSRRQLWMTDGTERGTGPVPGAERLEAAWLTAVGDRVLFYAFGARTGRISDLAKATAWITDGTGRGTTDLGVRDSLYFLRDAGLSGSRAVEAGGWIYFTHRGEDANPDLWRSDGTAAGTSILGDLVVHDLTPLGGRAVFVAASKFWLADAEQGAVTPFAELPPDTLSGVFDDAAAGSGVAYFTTGDRADLWRTDGTAAGTQELSTPEADLITELLPLGDSLVFLEQIWSDARRTSPRSVELWSSDGPGADARRIFDFGLGAYPFFGDQWTLGSGAVADGRVWFRVQTEASGGEIWSSDGTTAGTALVRDIAPGARGSRPGPLVAAGDQVFFIATDRRRGQELWVAGP